MTVSGGMLKAPVFSFRANPDGIVIRIDDDANPEYWHEVSLSHADLVAALAKIDVARADAEAELTADDIAEWDATAK